MLYLTRGFVEQPKKPRKSCTTVLDQKKIATGDELTNDYL